MTDIRVYIQPILLYSSETWALTRNLEDRIVTYDRFCLRRILQIPYTAHLPKLMYNSELALHHSCCRSRWLHFFGHMAQMSDLQVIFTALHMSIHGLPNDWRRRPGRPRHTWLRTLNRDLHPLNYGLNLAWRLAHTENGGGNLWKWLYSSPGPAHGDMKATIYLQKQANPVASRYDYPADPELYESALNFGIFDLICKNVRERAKC